jgi:DNA helicase-2/ATP-dependent DNA helicase PcrA
MLWLAQKPGTEVITLEDNFRSNSEITEAAQKMIEHNRTRLVKRTTSVKGAGGAFIVADQLLNEGAEIAAVAEGITGEIDSGTAPTEIAVLCRTNHIAYEYMKALDAAGIPVTKREKSGMPKDWPLARALVELMSQPDNDTLAYFFLVAKYVAEGQTPTSARKEANEVRLAANSQHRTINQSLWNYNSNIPAVAILGTVVCSHLSKETRMLLCEIVKEIGPESSPLDLSLAVAQRNEVVQEEAKEGVRVLTIHGAKGLEFDAVFLVGWEDETIPGRSQGNEIEEERRLAYVAVTRARELVAITHCKNRTTSWGAIATCTPSRFISELAGQSE